MNAELNHETGNGAEEATTGTETCVRDLATSLQRLGHIPVVYSPERGPIGVEE